MIRRADLPRETSREKRMHRAVNNILADARFADLVPTPEPDEQPHRLSFNTLLVRLQDRQRRFARCRGESLAMAIRQHWQRNGVLAKYAIQAYKDAYPYFVAANVTGAMPMSEILRNRALLALNTAEFGLCLGLDTVLVPGTREMAAQAVRRMMTLLSVPVQVIPIRTTAF
jgi:hypothetical protein